MLSQTFEKKITIRDVQKVDFVMPEARSQILIQPCFSQKNLTNNLGPTWPGQTFINKKVS